MEKILFLDLDGTVRQTKSGRTFINDPEDQELIPGVIEALDKYPDYMLIGITNQGGVAAGRKSYSDVLLTEKNTMNLLPRLKTTYYCTDFNGFDCYRLIRIIDEHFIERKIDFNIRRDLVQWLGLCRKPNPGMIEIAIADCLSKVYRNQCLFVGDRPEDQAAAIAANIPFIWAKDWRNDSIEST